MTLAPPYRGGAVALFDVQRVQRVLGKIVIAGQDRPHRLRRADRDGCERQDLRIAGWQRRRVLLREPADRHLFGGRGEPRRRSARFTLEVPASSETVIKLGTVRCTLSAKP